MARPASVSMIGLVMASSAAMLLARLWTSVTALCIWLRIVLSRLKDLTMRTPNTVSCITCMICATEEFHLHDALGPLQELVDRHEGEPARR